ncbi:MAG TPA: UxaA family hydrolase [Dehalococcoidales bacterium]|nr:UxaA family hydrolase [Dehalococcoidales bacterium]
METKLASAIVISEQDSVATATRNIKAGEKVKVSSGGKEYELLVKDDIKFLHKFALKNIKKDEKVLKYGWVIGQATGDISRGEHVHTHNLHSLRG